MAFVDLKRDRLILKVVLAGPPAVGKTERLDQIGKVGRRDNFGSTVIGPMQMATLPIQARPRASPRSSGSRRSSFWARRMKACSGSPPSTIGSTVPPGAKSWSWPWRSPNPSSKRCGCMAR
jgi:hypothetical protein